MYWDQLVQRQNEVPYKYFALTVSKWGTRLQESYAERGCLVK